MQGTPTRLRRAARLTALAAVAVGSLTATAAASAAPTLTVTPVRGLADGQVVTVSGTGYTTTEPNVYLGEVAVDGATVTADTSVFRWVHNSSTTAKMETDGSFSTTLTLKSSLSSGTIDCAAVQCKIAVWPAHTNPSVDSIIASQDLSFGPSIAVTPQSGIPAAGATLAVNGAGFDPAVNADGVYVAQAATVGGTRLYADTKWVSPTGAGGPILATDGTFSTTISAVAAGSFSVDGRGTGVTTVDCRDAATPCSIVTWAAHTDAISAWRTSQPLAFLADDVDPGTGGGGSDGGTATPSVSISPTSGLSNSAPTTISVSGSGFDPTARSAQGIYVMYGPLTATAQNQFYAAKWVAPGNAAGSDTDTMSASGTFSTALTVAPTYTDGTGAFVNCTVVQCAVRTVAAHGNPDRSQDTTTNIGFAGDPVASQPDTPVTTPDLVPDAPSTAPSTAGTASAGALVGPKLSRVAVGKKGKVALTVSEPSTVTLTVRRKVGKRYVVVKTITVNAKKAGAVSANLKLAKKGLYRVTIRAKGANGATKTVVKSVRVG